MKKVKIDPGCISCGKCEFLCPEVFIVKDKSYVKDNVDFDQWNEKIKDAAAGCPVKVISYEE